MSSVNVYSYISDVPKVSGWQFDFYHDLVFFWINDSLIWQCYQETNLNYSCLEFQKYKAKHIIPLFCFIISY